jgi:hypothetical protein
MMPSSPKRTHTEARANRILRDMSSFISASSEEAHKPLYPHGAIAGKLLGVYRNPSPFAEDLLITSEGIAIRTATQFCFLGYATIRDPQIVANGQALRGDGSTKHLADGISVTTEDDRQVIIPVRGGNSPYRDVFEFWRFLNFAIGENRTSAERPSCCTHS